LIFQCARPSYDESNEMVSLFCNSSQKSPHGFFWKPEMKLVACAAPLELPTPPTCFEPYIPIDPSSLCPARLVTGAQGSVDGIRYIYGPAMIETRSPPPFSEFEGIAVLLPFDEMDHVLSGGFVVGSRYRFRRWKSGYTQSKRRFQELDSQQTPLVLSCPHTSHCLRYLASHWPACIVPLYNLTVLRRTTGERASRNTLFQFGVSHWLTGILSVLEVMVLRSVFPMK
jgi:hypothetical protein